MIHVTRFEVPIWIKLFTVRDLKSRSESKDLWICSKSQSESNDSRYAIEVPIWIKRFVNLLEVPIWIKWFTLRDWSPDLNQKIVNLLEVPIWIKWFTLRDLKSRSESNYSQYAIWSPDLNQKICESARSPNLNQMIHITRLEVPIWIKWFTLRDLKSQSESNDSRYAIWSPDLNQKICESARSPNLNQMIHITRFEVPIWIKWFTLRDLKSRSESKDLWICSKSQSESNDHITRFEVPI